MRNVFVIFSLLGLPLFLASCTPKAMKPGECHLVITVEVDKPEYAGQAAVYQDEKFIGTTATKVDFHIKELSKGEHSIKITAEGFAEWEEKVYMRGGGDVQKVWVKLKSST